MSVTGTFIGGAMRYGSVCSGIEAASVAWEPLGWKCSFLSEIDPFSRAVLQHRYPDVPLRGDFREIQQGDHEAIDLLVGGTPCQAFSIAGLRKGLADDRGNLALEYIRLAQRLRPRWILWENVPGVLSSNGGRDFGSFLGTLGHIGYGWAYRVLDAQFFGVPQRRRRVFVVGHLGADWRRPAAVLFERESLRGHSKKGREAGEDLAACLTTGTGRRYDAETETLVAMPFDTTQVTSKANRSRIEFGRECHTLNANADPPAIAFNARQDSVWAIDRTGPLDTACNTHAVSSHWGVRRLTPTECERLQGFPDGHTAVSYRGKPVADGPRYKAIGNSMAVPCMRWIGERIAQVDAIS